MKTKKTKKGVLQRLFLGLWKLQFSLSWTWDRASAERDPVPGEERLPEGGKARVREFFHFCFLLPGRGSCGLYAPK